MSLKEILANISAEKAEALVKLLKQREVLTKQLSELDEEIESIVPTTKASNGSGVRRKPSVEIPDLLTKHPEGLTTKEIMAALAMNYPQVYATLTKLRKTHKVIANEETGKYGLKTTSKAKK